MKSDLYIPQSAYLKNMVRSIWQVGGTTRFQSETILPKGNIELIFNFGDEHPIAANLDNKQFQLGKCFINGFNTAPINLHLPGKHSLFGIELHPVAVKQLLRIPANKFSNIVVDLALINPSFSRTWQQLAGVQSFDERVNIISGWLQLQSIAFQPREIYLNNFLVNDLQQSISVSELAKTVCYSTRQLSRKMTEITNLNTEDLLLYKKYLRSLKLVQEGNLSLTAIAYESHFADQSHFIKTFRSFTQLTPAQYRQNKSQLQGHIFEHVR